MYFDENYKYIDKLKLLKNKRNSLNLPDYYWKYQKVKGFEVDSYYRKIKWIVEKYKLIGKDILEIGSHFGWESFMFAEMGVRNITGIEYKIESLEISETLKRYLAINTAVNFKQMDVEKLNFKSNKFDFIYCNCVISHVSNYFEGYKNIFRVLKQGGVFFLTDENNFLKNRKFRRNNWIKADFGPKEISKTVFVEEPLINIRKQKILELYPNTASGMLEKLAKKTYGYACEELEDIIHCYMKNEIKIKKKKVARHPITGYWYEREINPFTEIRLLRKIGFSKARLTILFEKKRRNFYKNLLVHVIDKVACVFLIKNTHFNVIAKKSVLK